MPRETESIIGSKGEMPTAENPFIFRLLLQSRELEKSVIALIEVYEPPGRLAMNRKREISPFFSLNESKGKIIEATDEMLKGLKEKYQKGHERHEMMLAFETETNKKLETLFSQN